MPLELLGFGAGDTLSGARPSTAARCAQPSPDGGLIADYLGAVGIRSALALRLSTTPGVVEHGLFAPSS